MFTIHRSERADALVDALADVLQTPVGDPFSPEIVAVPTRGVERWLTHRLGATLGASPGRADGVCANVAFPFPGRLVGDVLADATGVARDEDPWRPERSVWPLLRVIDECLDEPWLALLAGHLGADRGGTDGEAHGDLRAGRRFSTARHLADLFDRYGVFRPEMVLSWHDGDDQVPDDARWQPELWRRLRTAVDSPSPAERVAHACARLRAGTVDVDLPSRISLFGLTRLPATYLDVLRALATQREIHLYALHPSLVLWDRVADRPVPTLPLSRDQDPSRQVPTNPLLATWATDTREMQLVLSAAADAHAAHHPVVVDEPTTLLARIQADVRADVAPPGPPTDGGPDRRLVLHRDDRSIQIHSCHGRARQVEVARDAILHALADDPTIEPRDVIVLCPDIDEFAPLLHATFGSAGHLEDDAPEPTGGVHDLPYRLADRSLRQTNPLLASLDALLTMIDGRLTAPELLTFAGREPVRTRFRLDDDALEQLRSWTADSNIRWGLDADRRTPYWLGDVDANTWRAGIDRLLVGVSMDLDGARLVGGRLPVDDVESGDVDLAGRFAELVARVDTVATACSIDQPVDGWTTTLGDAVDLLMDCRSGDAWQRVQVGVILREVLAEATTDDAVAPSPLSLAEVRALLADRLKGRPTRADFRTGAVTMCTLVPMRAVPHRVVCILGLDDGSFPRNRGADGDDLLRRTPMVGDHDSRAEDRQLLLDAVLATTDRLIITTTGHDVRTNEPRPPAVPLSELIEVVRRTTADADRILVEHPLQPFDPRNHVVGDRATDPASPHPWGFDRVQLDGARTLAQIGKPGRRSPEPVFGSTVLPAVAPADGIVTLDELSRFVQHPVREYLRQRLGISTWDGDDALDDAIPVELDALQQWSIGQRLVERLMAGETIDDAVEAELASGALPPGAMGRQTIESIRETALHIHGTAERVEIADATGSLEVDVDLGEVAVVGTVAGIRGHRTGAVSYSSVAPRHRLQAWVRLVALSAAHPETPWQAVSVGKYRRVSRAVAHGPIEGSPDQRAAIAAEHLRTLVHLRASGLREPLPMPCKTSAAWADARRRRRAPEKAARRDWETTFTFDQEDVDPHHRRVWGGVLRLDQLLTSTPTEAESGDGWAMDEDTRLGRLARRLWDPVLDAEQAP